MISSRIVLIQRQSGKRVKCSRALHALRLPRARRRTLSAMGAMSIFSAAAMTTPPVTTAPTPAESMRQYAILAALSVASLTIAALSGCFRPRNILGRPRLGEREPLTTVWLITAVAAILWIFVPVAYVIFTLPQHIQSPATSPATEPLTAGQLPPIDFTPAETVALSAAG